MIEERKTSSAETTEVAAAGGPLELAKSDSFK